MAGIATKVALNSGLVSESTQAKGKLAYAIFMAVNPFMLLLFWIILLILFLMIYFANPFGLANDSQSTTVPKAKSAKRAFLVSYIAYIIVMTGFHYFGATMFLKFF